MVVPLSQSAQGIDEAPDRRPSMSSPARPRDPAARRRSSNSDRGAPDAGDPLAHLLVDLCRCDVRPWRRKWAMNCSACGLFPERAPPSDERQAARSGKVAIGLARAEEACAQRPLRMRENGPNTGSVTVTGDDEPMMQSGGIGDSKLVGCGAPTMCGDDQRHAETRDAGERRRRSTRAGCGGPPWRPPCRRATRSAAGMPGARAEARGRAPA